MTSEGNTAKGTVNYAEMGVVEKLQRLLEMDHEYANPDEVEFRINADYLKFNCHDECYRERMVSFIPMLPLLEKTVEINYADYILYAHPYARCEEFSEVVVNQLKFIAKYRKEGAQIIVVGKSANAEKLLNGEIDNIIFWGDHFTEKLGKKFGFDIREQYFVYDDEDKHLAIWPVDGCLNKCKFCRRSYMEIKFESIPLDVIKRNLDFYKQNAPEKMRKISLRAENLTQYGLDIYGKQMLHELIDLVDGYEEVEIINFDIGMAIGEITPEILDALCRTKKIQEIVMNVEAGSNRMLNLIGKMHTREDAIYVFQTLRKFHPDLKIWTVAMLGLPTEELEDMEALADLIVQIKPDLLQINYYVCTPQQPLARFPQISESLREYHLEFFLKTLKRYVKNLKVSRKWEMKIVCNTILKKIRYKRWGIKRLERIKKQNEDLYYFCPVHMATRHVIEVTPK